MNIPLFIYPFIIRWNFGLFPSLGYHGWYSYKHSCASIVRERTFSFLLGIELGAEWLGQVVILCLIIWGTARQSSRVDATFYFSTMIVRRSWFLHILTNTVLIWLVGSNNPSGCEVVSIRTLTRFINLKIKKLLLFYCSYNSERIDTVIK